MAASLLAHNVYFTLKNGSEDNRNKLLQSVRKYLTGHPGTLFFASAALPSTPNLRDAILVVLKTQELAGIDVVSDGELSRFDVNHPETNGMIDFFIRPLEGIRTALTRLELEEFRRAPGM